MEQISPGLVQMFFFKKKKTESIYNEAVDTHTHTQTIKSTPLILTTDPRSTSIHVS